MATTVEQLAVAFERSGWTLDELLSKSGLDLVKQSLGRKLHGEIRMSTDEAEMLALALREWLPRGRIAIPTRTRS
jgi:hypothetical protein